jgi:hypothetical protein
MVCITKGDSQMTTEITKKSTIYDLLELKANVLKEYENLFNADKNISNLMDMISNHGIHCLDFKNLGYYGEKRIEKGIDQKLWFELIKTHQLKNYMLCTDYDKMQKEIDDFKFPEFNEQNAEGWMLGLKSMIYDNIKNLVVKVYDEITQKTYMTGGSSYNNSIKKKRNNNGIDKHFILSTGDNYALQSWNDSPTITDDLEKVCYLLAGEELPEMGIKRTLRKNKQWESENEYFRIKICLNGNTHYWIKDEIRNKLNLYGSKKGVIGENIKIKVFDK